MAVFAVYLLLYSIPILFLLIAQMIIYFIGFILCLFIYFKKRELNSKFAHSVARRIFNMKAGPNDCGEKPQTLLFGYVVPNVYIYQILLFSILLCCNSMMIFWDTFLIEESYLCNSNVPNLHCYSHNSSDELNCSNTTETSVYCYQFVFNFSSAAGNATGVFLMSSIVFAINTWLLLRISKGKHGTRKQKCRALCVQLTEFVGIIILQFIFPYIVDFAYFKSKHIILRISFFLTLQLSISMPWWRFYKPEEQHEMSSYQAEQHEHVQTSSYQEEQHEHVQTSSYRALNNNNNN